MAEGGVVPVMRIDGTYCHLPSTLTRVEEPYPMLVLCGPPGSGKGYLTKLLVEEFPSMGCWARDYRHKARDAARL